MTLIWYTLTDKFINEESNSTERSMDLCQFIPAGNLADTFLLTPAWYIQLILEDSMIKNFLPPKFWQVFLDIKYVVYSYLI